MSATSDEDKEAEIVEALEGSFGLANPKSRMVNKTMDTMRAGEVLRLTLTGHTKREIATKMGMSEKSVERHLQSDAVLTKLKRQEESLRKAALRRVKLQADELVGVIIGIAKGEKGDEKAADRLRAAQTALDRIGLSAREGQVNVNVQVGPALTTGELIARAETITIELKQIEADNETDLKLLDEELEIIDVESD